jgi:methyl-accepting chemotaxis protein
LARSDAYNAIFEGKAPYRGEVQILDEPYMTAYDPIFGANGELLGILYVGLKKAEFLKSAHNTLLMIIGATLLIAVIAMTASCFLARNNIVRPLRSSIDTMKRLAKGDLSAATPAARRNDEIGEIRTALASFKQTLIAKEASDQATAIEAAAKIERAHRIDEITHEFEALIGEVIETVSSASNRLEDSAGALTKTAARAQELTTTVAATSEQASTNVQSVASATEEMSQSIGEISRHVHESARIASEAVKRANDTNARVGELAQAAARIGDVVELINTIAGQTNLLALNATIEAARAGEAGRGFAVVASEVKALAEQTAKATGEIGQQNAGIQSATRESVDAIQTIGATIGKMSEISATIALAVEQQGASAQDISRNVQQAAMGTQQVTSNIAAVQHGADETGATSVQVHTAAQSLSRDSLRLKSEVDRFMNAVRAA